MPRNPAAKRNQHNNRHENGLVGPGKRVTKQKSNGHLNGVPKGPGPDESVPGLPEPATNDTTTVSSSATSVVSKSELIQRPRQVALKEKDSESSLDLSSLATKPDAINGTTEVGRSRTETMAMKRKSSDVSSVQLASTILRSCPAGDTIALLILLLALPSMLLTAVQALFASLTLMPGTGTYPMSFLSLFEAFQGSGGAPSLVVMAVMDLVCFGLWMCLWNWAQHFALDLAQIQIAITLGNGNAGRDGKINTICCAIVLLQHTIRSKGVRQFLYSNLVPESLIAQTQYAKYLRYLPDEKDLGRTPSSASKWRSIFAIHILSQAFMAFVRRRVANSQNGVGTKLNRRTDTEASAGSGNAEPAVPSQPANTASATGVDYQPPPTPSFKDLKEKGITAKKRRRQANQVRSRQPFWAALASTKVHVLREVEHSKGNSNSNNQNFHFDDNDVVWITDVEPDSIYFEALYDDSYNEIDAAREVKPFFVRINGARWHSVTLEQSEDNEDDDASKSSRWIGAISGLAPNCTYTCTFISEEDDIEFASVMVRTPALSETDIANYNAPVPARQSTRPSSPTTTLKNSISTAEAKLNDARNRLAKTRQQHKKAVTKIEKEVDSVNTRLKSNSDDTKQRQKLLQAERNIKSTEDATTAINSALDELDTIPEDDVVDYSARKEVFEKHSRNLSIANESLAKARSDANNDLACVKNELNTINTRKQRLTSRQTKLVEDHDQITQANAQGLSEKERKARQSADRQSEQQKKEAEMVRELNAVRDRQNQYRADIDTVWRQINAAERESQQAYLRHMNPGPLTPEGTIPGSNPAQPITRPFGFGNLQAPAFFPPIPQNDQQPSPFLDYARTLPLNGPRPRSDTNRSAGATSNLSGEFEDADPIPPMLANSEFTAGARKGSGSSRGNNGSPAGGTSVIGGVLRSPQRGNHSPATTVHGAVTW